MKPLILFLFLLTLSSLLVACSAGSGSPPPDFEPSAAPSRTAAHPLNTSSPTLLPASTRTPPPTRQVVAAGSAGRTCRPTLDDGVSPSYKPDAPSRSSVGTGHVLSGVVRSSEDCAPIANARLELWPEYAGQGHPDEVRATLFTDSNGRYRFECDPPEHIHMRISAAGYRTIGQNSYHPNGQAEGTFDIVLELESP
jgi:protocatechuate 3,4-dioxygenase beta subunit